MLIQSRFTTLSSHHHFRHYQFLIVDVFFWGGELVGRGGGGGGGGRRCMRPITMRYILQIREKKGMKMARCRTRLFFPIFGRFRFLFPNKDAHHVKTFYHSANRKIPTIIFIFGSSAIYRLV